ncbi:putative alpha-L-fucosidase isoform X2 [Toxorhynchites rutilus septentrionalis]|uniref:putative alpha-L-fucosidase isoform X1 n=1 Tax=Toxorhynchites rutilus septentrionalis TaxID=329112 RepID=UPI0024784BC9|nr:putative alpha-L-fucosidase isoform X1 [Toxorhynchites rutilus septentrionalis]XP_055630196.1 putative alpha-L-fucosidase isoform X2 [Toxorhynchites rutilus septentrionalis]
MGVFPKSLFVFLMIWISSTTSNFQESNDIRDAVETEEDVGKYQPTWVSLDSRPLPKWYDDAKIGIFIHWGVYSVPSYGSEWFWINWKGYKYDEYVNFMENNYKPGFTYQDFAGDFTAELFNATEWAELFAKSGARYVVLTSKHHEGYTLWPSKYTYSWNSADIGPHRDIIGELSTAIRKNTKLTFGLYYSLFEWFNRLYNDDKLHAFLKSDYVDTKVWPELKEMINMYKPEILWSDGDWEAPDEYWKAKEFFTWLYNDSPVKDTVVTNDRWGMGTLCLHGDFYTCSDRYNPGVLQPHKWENAMTIDKKSWGHRQNAKFEDFITSDELIGEIATTVSCGGNININVGPSKYGTIDPIFVERLTDMGRWLKTNGEAIYKTKPWKYQNDTLTSEVWYTSRGVQSGEELVEFTNVYAIVLNYPYKTNSVLLGAFDKHYTDIIQITMLGFNTSLKYTPTETGILVDFPVKNEIDRLRLDYAWTLKIVLSTKK